MVVLSGATKVLNAKITSLNLKLSGLSKKRTRLYEDYAEGLLDEEEYTFAKKSYDEQYADLSRRLDETGNYLECTFPFMGVRFISINDG